MVTARASSLYGPESSDIETSNRLDTVAEPFRQNFPKIGLSLLWPIWPMHGSRMKIILMTTNFLLSQFVM